MTTKREFFEALQGGNLERVKELLRQDPGLAAARDDAGVSAILQAQYRSRSDIVEALLAHHPGLDILEAAALGKDERVAELLTGQPGLASAYAPDGFTPLGLAAFFGHREIAELLLARGADVNAVSRNATGYTALTGAVARGDAGIVAALLAAGANANHRYAQGYSALHEAAAGGNSALVKLLLEHDADPNARMDDGKTPADLAAARGHEELANQLRTRPASAGHVQIA
jgi:ankyrin repeat protein